MTINLTERERLEMHSAAATRLETLDDWLFDGEEGEAPYSLAPYCGCLDCTVREALDAAYLKLEELR